MVLPFDIFKLQKDGSVRWCEAVDTFEAAEARVAALARSAPAQYIIFHQQTGQKVIIDCSRGSSAAQTPTPRAPARRPTYHICRVENENLRWIEQVDTLQAAQARIKELKAAHPADYVVLDYDPHEGEPPPWMPLTCVMANYLISSVVLRFISA
jgi:hypothetical protein